MTNRIVSLLEHAARVRRMIEDRSRNSNSSDLQILRLKRHWLLVRRHLEQSLNLSVPAGPAVALVRVHRVGSAQR